MTKSVDVSVIMPTYNCLEYLPKAVHSVLMQNVDLELLIIDDQSTDGSAQWLEALQNKDTRIRVIKGEHKGVSAARNLAIAQARGQWLAFLDADDYWYSNKLKQQLEIHQCDPDVVLSFTDYDHFSEAGSDLGRCFRFWPGFDALLKPEINMLNLNGALKTVIYAENVIGTSTVLVNKTAVERVGGFDEHLQSASDWDLWLKLHHLGNFVAINQPLMGYLVRSNSISRNAERRLESFELILERFREAMTALNPSCYPAARARLKLAQAECWQASEGGYWKASKAYIQACYQLPTHRNIRALLSHLLKGYKTQ
ncbi:glycosyltransferase family 2 protein [Oceanospirillum sediminis]|uniref:Glycosyltransferase family 2 protein n=1 Tax=Oceanospirillum sediminis TaxID=2760088 RepID=A0A839IWU3_9GAMM|nr:glycosyltransferase family A protein [Oceanospirillum sediminis]MBB1489094.1 glycosyltransferase family 2 protein [Oceanospirillum sediminis]